MGTFLGRTGRAGAQAALVALAAMLWAAVPPAGAAPRAVGFDEAQALAEQAPVVQAARAALTAKRAMDARISGMTQNPQLYAQLGYRQEVSAGGLEVQGQVQQGVNLAGLGAARQRSVALEEHALAQAARAAAFAQRLRAAQAWTVLWGAQAALGEAEREAQLAAEFLARVQAGAQAGALTQVDVAEAQTYAAESRVAVLTLEGECFDGALELGRAVGAAEPLRADGPLPEKVLPPGLVQDGETEARARLLAAAERLPEAAARLGESEAERAREREAHAQKGTVLSLGVLGLREPVVPYAVLGTLQLTLPVFDRGERERGDLVASHARLRGAAETAARGARTDLTQVLHEHTHTREVWAELRDHGVPAGERAVRLRERLLGAGEGTALELILARRGLLALRARAARAEAAHHGAQARLWLYVRETEPAQGEVR